MNEQLFATLLILYNIDDIAQDTPASWNSKEKRQRGGGGGGQGGKTGSILHVALGGMLLKTLLAGRVPGLHCS